MVGFQNEMKILEVGSGPGYITEILHDTYPDSKITCLEINKELIDIAKNKFESTTSGFIDFVFGSILDTNLPSETFDVVYARLVLQHVHSPEKAIQEMYQLVKPGGSIIITEAEDTFTVLTPEMGPKGYIDRIFTIFQNLQVQQGGDRTIGRKIPKILKNTGFIDIKLNYPIVHSDIDSPDLIKGAITPSMYKPLLDNGLITKADFEIIVDYHSKFPDGENALGMMGVLVITGKKPKD